MSVRILVVDDHEVVREGVRTILSRARPQWEIIGECASGQEALAAVPSLKPDVVLLDVTMPGMSGLEAASRMSALGVPSQILIFTMHDSGELARDARKCGAKGYVTKTDAGRHLVQAIEALVSGGTFFGSPQKSQEPDSKNKPGLALLFRRALKAT